ncbi:FAD-dependent monooxygenase [Acidovorax sp. FG27]|uniref:FAD-dependent monooxygenase n=1 Tax=Acidovorax sp. FG27 TaxID=3133652 RepID=UPI0030E8549D
MQQNKQVVLIAGGGIGGLAAAIAASRAGCAVRLFERAPAFAEVGAGLQLGPNGVRRLRDWGLERALQAVAAFPERLQVRSAVTGAELAAMPLGADIARRYGAAYATLHRADLHGLLLGAAQSQGDLQTHLADAVARHRQSDGQVTVTLTSGATAAGDVLIGADGLRSVTRAQLLGEQAARASGHLAYRAMVRQADLPAALRTAQVTAWLGPRLHVVQYPVRRGEWMNIVAIRHGTPPADLDGWDHAANAADLESALSGTCAPLQDTVRAVPRAGSGWRLWPLSDRPPVRGPLDLARGRVALLGDAAHPMRPYLAQGAGMAIEDAAALQAALEAAGTPMADRLRHYASQRWQRVARVQARAQRNGRIFHAVGPVRWGRDLALRWGGARLLDLPWLYGG